MIDGKTDGLNNKKAFKRAIMMTGNTLEGFLIS
jgi:hypothetical protein